MSAVAFVMLCIASPVLATEPSKPSRAERGTVCLAPLPQDVRKIDRDYPDGKPPHDYAYKFTVQIDDGREYSVLEVQSVLISDLDLERRHLVKIRDTGKVVESFRFHFDTRKSNDLCLWYGPWYQTWSMWTAREGKAFCKCQVSE